MFSRFFWCVAFVIRIRITHKWNLCIKTNDDYLDNRFTQSLYCKYGMDDISTEGINYRHTVKIVDLDI